MPEPSTRRLHRRQRAIAVRRRRTGAAVALVVLVIVILIASSGGSGGPRVIRPPLPGLGHPARSGNPFAYVPAHEAAFEARAASGNAQPLFTKSPGGVIATAARVAGYRTLIDQVTRGTAVPPDMLEGLMFLESAGEPEAIAGTDPSAAAGLTQIVASTGQSLLGMSINLTESRKLTAKIEAAGDDPALVTRLQRQRAAIDPRFDPAKELAATVRYLQIAAGHFGGRMDLAFESYHMGIGNLEDVLSDFDGGTPVPYAEVYFESTPAAHASTYTLLQSFDDESPTYLWRLEAAVQIMHLYRTDRAALIRLNSLETGFFSNALVLVPQDRYKPFADAAQLSAAYQRREILPLPSDPRSLGLQYAPTMGSQAAALKVPRALYSGLRPAALDLLIELSARVQALSGTRAPLIVANTVTDNRYENALGVTDPPAPTGYTFEIIRHYASGAQANAFQAMLQELQSLNLIAWVRGTSTIEITVAPDADRVIADGV